MFARSRLWWLAVVSVAALAVVMLLAITLTRPSPPAPLPNPNGYDDFLKAGTVVVGPVGDFPTLEHNTLRDLVSTNAEALRLLRLGLTRQCAVPAGIAVTNMAGMMTDLAGMKRLVQLLAAEGRLHELDDQPMEAARTYLDAIRFGNEISRGGLLINRLVGVACEAIGRAPLAKLLPKLKPEEARKIIAELERIDQTRVTWAEVQRGEKRFARHMLPRVNLLAWVVQWPQLLGSIKRASEKHNRIIAQERLLTVELALRCYQFDTARAPTRLEDLVPNYLSTVPQDPFSGQAMIYRPQGTNWLLYSIGDDRADNGGRPIVRGASSPGDLLYNAP
jgi:hypothetical protein